MSTFERAPRTTAIAIGLGLLIAIEGLCRLAGVGDPRDRPDPFAGFSRLQPTFTRGPGTQPAVYTAGDGDATARQLDPRLEGKRLTPRQIETKVDRRLSAPYPILDLLGRRPRLRRRCSVDIDVNLDGIISFDECELTEEEIGLILDTKSAHTFNFLAYDIGSGSHTIEAYCRLAYNGEVVEGSGTAEASASLGKSTLSVWEVHGAMTN